VKAATLEQPWRVEKEVEAFVERISKRVNDNPRASHSGKHRATFIALRRLVEAALARGIHDEGSLGDATRRADAIDELQDLSNALPTSGPWTAGARSK
jgi:hypothetical protein